MGRFLGGVPSKRQFPLHLSLPLGGLEPGGLTGIPTFYTRTLQLVNGGVQLYLGVEKATCFKWLQDGDLLRSPVQ